MGFAQKEAPLAWLGRWNLKRRLLVIDRDDIRRKTRVTLLLSAGYEVELRDEHLIAEEENHDVDLIILAVRRGNEREDLACSERLREKNSTLPILLLTDTGVVIPKGTLSQSVEAGYPLELIRKIEEMLA